MPDNDGVTLDYRGYDGGPVRTRFRFTGTGKISLTACTSERLPKVIWLPLKISALLRITDSTRKSGWVRKVPYAEAIGTGPDN
jgi:hypothetical protein